MANIFKIKRLNSGSIILDVNGNLKQLSHDCICQKFDSEHVKIFANTDARNEILIKNTELTEVNDIIYSEIEPNNIVLYLAQNIFY